MPIPKITLLEYNTSPDLYQSGNDLRPQLIDIFKESCEDHLKSSFTRMEFCRRSMKGLRTTGVTANARTRMSGLLPIAGTCQTCYRLSEFCIFHNRTGCEDSIQTSFSSTYKYSVFSSAHANTYVSNNRDLPLVGASLLSFDVGVGSLAEGNVRVRLRKGMK